MPPSSRPPCNPMPAECAVNFATMQQTDRAITDQLAAMGAKIDKMHESIVGNGKPGLEKRVGLLEHTDGKRSHLFWFVLSVVIGPAIGALSAIVVSGIWNQTP